MGKSLINTIGKLSSTVENVNTALGNATVLTLSKAWVGIGMVHPARTNEDEKIFGLKTPKILSKGITADPRTQVTSFETAEEVAANAKTPEYNRFDSSRLYSIEIGGTDGDYFLPLSQTYTLSAKKRQNVSELVDGIDIIQQTRKQAKVINGTLRISLDDRKNLNLVDANAKVVGLHKFLDDLYEKDTVFRIVNDMINDTFGVEYCIMNEYKFSPRQGMGTYTFEFTFTEVKYGDNVLTFDATQIDGSSNGEIT